MTYDPTSPDYYKEEALRQELNRVLDICAGCRRCLPLCPAFPALFDAIDAKEGDITQVTDKDLRQVIDFCYQCKLCYPHCPFTPDEGHRFKIDFPHLMLRAKAVRARREGVRLQDRILGNPDRMGRFGSAMVPFSNWANRFKPNRIVMEKLIGIHRDRNLPLFYRETFEKWWKKRSAMTANLKNTSREVILFPTCYVNWNNPAVGKAAVAVLEHNGCKVICPPTNCCGMPFLDAGNIDAFQRNVEANLKVLIPEVEAGRDIVVPGPTCSYVLKYEYPMLYRGEAADYLAAHTFDLCEYLIQLYSEGALNTSFQGNLPRRIAYHFPCHLKVQRMGFKSRDLLKLLPGTEVKLIERCSGMDGSWGLKRQYYETSKKLAEPLFQEIRAADPQIVVTDCPLAGLQIAEGTGIQPVHPVVVLYQAYGLPEK
jgi:Fe-S oxidoreductase